MKVVIVCESMFGNTELLADAVASGLVSTGAEVRQIGVGSVRPEDLGDCDLLIVAAPTHALSLSRPESRAEAVERGADPSRASTGVREWLVSLVAAMPPEAGRPLVAVFDTRVGSTRHWPGSAARRAARTLRLAGFVIVDRVSFFVEGIIGPVAPGQVQRAIDWGAGLQDRAAQTAATCQGTAHRSA